MATRDDRFDLRPESERPMFVQFPHPGSEHRPTGHVMDWTRGSHARKFMKASGRYLDGGSVLEGPFVFWGEWEPQSTIIETYPKGVPGGPRWLHEPHWQVPRHPALLQNTDPLVFGDHFIYGNCRQERNSKLRRLRAGSIILFGSRLPPDFVLDTVFVVDAEGQDYTIVESGSIAYPDWVRAVVFDRMRVKPDRPPIRFRLYRGRPYDPDSDAPFSFVPCRPYEPGASAFPRPAIRLDRRWIEPKLALGAKATPATDREIRQLWQEVIDQVQRAGLGLGIELSPPPNAPDLPTTGTAKGY